MSVPDPVELLRALAKQYRARVVTTNRYDPHIATSKGDWRSLEKQPPPPDRIRYQTRVKVDGRRFAVYANDRYVAIETRDAQSDVAFSVNSPDHVLWLTRRLKSRLGSRRLPVFVFDDVASLPITDDPEMARCTENLELRRGESVHVARNGVMVYIKPRSLQRIVDVLNHIGAFIRQLPEPAPRVQDLSDLPKKFSDLIPLMKTWAKSDDDERSGTLERASDARLVSLVDRVRPHFAAINKYLDSFEDGIPSESATVLGTLAECACEAALLLERRRK